VNYLERRVGPLPVYAWLAIGFGVGMIVRKTKGNYKEIPQLPVTLIGSWFPSFSSYSPPMVMPVGIDVDSPTPGAQGGILMPGHCPATATSPKCNCGVD
jgi:hypothetical protein